jgi:hypothetical protein
VAAALLVLGGCGSGASRHATAATATPSAPAEPTATPSRPPVDIVRPAAGARVPAEPAGHGRLRATVTLSGFAPPGSHVRIRSGCAAAACAATGRADENGMWRARLQLVATAAHPAAAVQASCSVPGPPRRRVLRLRAVRAPARKPHRSRATPAPAASAPPAVAPAPAGTRVRRMVLIGDSLAVGIENLLPSMLPGWTIHSDGAIGRPLATGMRLIEGADLTSRPTVLAVSLFTNDDPRATAALAAAVQRSVALVGGRGCVVWATVVRPPVGGVSYAAANATLRRLAAGDGGALLLVPWAEEVARHPDWVGADHVHGTPAGYAARAALYSRAARSCRR